MRVYIAGTMTGKFDYKEYFMRAEKYVKELGHIVVNPAYLPEGLDNYFEINKAMIDQCDAIYVLLDYENSEGTSKEIEYATKTKKQVMYQTREQAGEIGWKWMPDYYSRYPYYYYGAGAGLSPLW